MLSLSRRSIQATKLFKIQSARFSTPIGQALVEAVKNLPFRNAIKTFEQDYNLTQDQTIVQAKSYANGMYDMGLRPKDSTLLWMDNSLESIISFYGCALSGIHCHLIDPSIRYPAHIEKLLTDVKAKSIVFSPEYKGVDRTVTLGTIIPQLSEPRRTNMIRPLSLLQFPDLRYVITTYFDKPLYNNILNYRSVLTYQAYPDYADLVLPRLEGDFPLLTYHYLDEKTNELKVSKTFTQSEVTDVVNEMIKKLNIETDHNICHAATTCTPFGVFAALSCALTNASFGIISAEPSINKVINALSVVHFDGLFIDEHMLKKITDYDPLLVKDCNVKYGMSNGSSDMKLNDTTIQAANIPLN